MPHPEFRAATFCGSKDPKVLAAPAAAPAFLKSPGRPMDPMAMRQCGNGPRIRSRDTHGCVRLGQNLNKFAHDRGWQSVAIPAVIITKTFASPLGPSPSSIKTPISDVISRFIRIASARVAAFC